MNAIAHMVQPVELPAWRGPAAVHRLLDRAPVVPQPRKPIAAGRPAQWKPWTLLTPAVAARRWDHSRTWRVLEVRP